MEHRLNNITEDQDWEMTAKLQDGCKSANSIWNRWYSHKEFRLNNRDPRTGYDSGDRFVHIIMNPDQVIGNNTADED